MRKNEPFITFGYSNHFNRTFPATRSRGRSRNVVVSGVKTVSTQAKSGILSDNT